MEQYLEALKELKSKLNEIIDEQKVLTEKLQWSVDFFHEVIMKENRELIEEKIANEIKEDLDEDDDDLEKLSEEESEVLP
jgi:hypothetical protein